MYTITTAHQTGTAATIPTALVVLAGQLREALTRDGRARWTVTDPTGLEHLGISYLNGRTDLLADAVADVCYDLYDQLHRSADGGPGVF